MNPTQLMSIDPSIHTLGWAIAEVKDFAITECGVIKCSNSVSYHDAAMSMATTVLAIMPDTCAYLIVENPQVFGTSRGTASMASESIQKLYYAVGLMIGWIAGARCFPPLHIGTVKPSTWKGTAKKDIMVKRAHKRVPSLLARAPHDTCEAIMLAEYAAKRIDERHKRFLLPIIDAKTVVARTAVETF